MSEIGNMMSGLPMSELIGAPLLSVVSAQRDLAQVMIDYVTTVGLEGPDSPNARLLKFSIDRPVLKGDELTSSNMTIQAPVLGILPVPQLLADLVNIDFQMEVSTATSSKSNTSAEVSASASGGFFGQKYSVSGKVTTAKENTRNTNQSAKYQVHVEAKQQPQTECLARLLDILATCTEPLKIEASSEGGSSGEASVA